MNARNICFQVVSANYFDIGNMDQSAIYVWIGLLCVYGDFLFYIFTHEF